jgi:hypothetical protein
MTGRWTRSPEPAVVYMPAETGTVPVLVNPTALEHAVDIYPGETEILDVVARFDEDTDCYGWNDETYFVPDWRNPERKLEHVSSKKVGSGFTASPILCLFGRPTDRAIQFFEPRLLRPDPQPRQPCTADDTHDVRQRWLPPAPTLFDRHKPERSRLADGILRRRSADTRPGRDGVDVERVRAVLSNFITNNAEHGELACCEVRGELRRQWS